MGKSTISMAIFNSYVSLPAGNLVDEFSFEHHPLSGYLSWPKGFSDLPAVAGNDGPGCSQVNQTWGNKLEDVKQRSAWSSRNGWYNSSTPKKNEDHNM